MKGLFIKDFEIIKNNGRFLILMLFLIAVLLMTSPEFAIMYVSLFLTIYTCKTISYDESRNGFLYLFSWPISRREYVLEKFLLSGGTSFICALICAIICMFLEIVPVREIMLSLISALIISLLLASIFIPVQLKFGSERSTLVFFLLSVGIGVLIASVSVLSAELSVSLSYFLAIDLPRNLDFWIALAVVIVIAIMAASIYISTEILKKKEF